MAELNTVSQSDFTKLADVIWLDGLASVVPAARNSGLFKIVPIPAGTGDTREFSEIDLNEYALKKDEGDQAARAGVQQGYTKTMYVDRFARDISITYEMRTRNKYPEVIARLTNLGKMPVQRQELDLQHRIGFGTATSYTDMDGDSVDISTGDTLELFYSAHTLRGSSETFRNRLANNPRVSKGALEGIERLVTEETLSQFGEKRVIPFDILWSTDDPNSVNTINEYLQSTADVEGAHAGIVNVLKGKYRHVILPLVGTDNVGFTDTDKRYYWGIASSVASSAYLGIWEEPRMLNPVELGKDSTEDWAYGSRAGWGIVIVSGNFIKGSTGDGAA